MMNLKGIILRTEEGCQVLNVGHSKLDGSIKKGLCMKWAGRKGVKVEQLQDENGHVLDKS